MTLRPHLFDLGRIGAGLVVADAIADLERAIATGSAVVTAPPGTGKTTFVPPLVANVLGGTGSGRVVVTQPRRVAVRAAARRIAQLDGSTLGGPVGFTVRGERTVSTATRIEIVTPGVLLRRLLADPALDGVDAVIVDEVHERSLDGDLLLGILAEVRALRDDFSLVAMSATLDADAFAELLGAAVVQVPSALHPLRIDYAPPAGSRLDARGVTRAFLDHVARVAVEAQAADRCDALVFVPSARDVNRVVSRIRDLTSAVDPLPLHGQLPAREQDRATSGREPGSGLPRIVVSTSLAESSLTVPGVRLVIDAGLSREVRRDQARDMSGLVTVSASRASAEQRAGRAARQGPGRVVRTYGEAEFAAFRPDVGPEIQSADLTDAALLLAGWGTPEARGLSMLTPPPEASLRQATATLESLGLITNDGRITPLGTRVAQMPLGAREGRALLAAVGAVHAPNSASEDENEPGSARAIDARSAAEIVAATSSGVREPGGDLAALVRALRRGEPGSGRWRIETKRLARLADGHGSVATRERECPPAEGTDSEVDEAPSSTAGAPDSDGVAPRGAAPTDDLSHAAGVVAALARPAWIARRAGDGSRAYVFASGTRAALPEGSSLAGSEWIAACEVQRAEGRAADATGAVIRLAAAMHEQDALRIGGVRALRHTTVTERRVRVREERRVGAIVLSSTPARPQPDECAGAFEEHLRANGLRDLAWPEAATSLRRRLALLHRTLGDPWPDVSDDALLARLDEWLSVDLRQPSLHGIDLVTALKRILPWPDAGRLGALAPEHLAVPSGSSVRIEYPEDPEARPVVAVKLQEVFGLTETPRLAEGRVPVQFHLLSPARRPLAVTDDLASFWNGPYQDVRKEMRGRYPKHPWPEDPWTAPATARTNRALRG